MLLFSIHKIILAEKRSETITNNSRLELIFSILCEFFHRTCVEIDSIYRNNLPNQNGIDIVEMVKYLSH